MLVIVFKVVANGVATAVVSFIAFVGDILKYVVNLIDSVKIAVAVDFTFVIFRWFLWFEFCINLMKSYYHATRIVHSHPCTSCKIPSVVVSLSHFFFHLFFLSLQFSPPTRCVFSIKSAIACNRNGHCPVGLKQHQLWIQLINEIHWKNIDKFLFYSKIKQFDMEEYISFCDIDCRRPPLPVASARKIQ